MSAKLNPIFVLVTVLMFFYSLAYAETDDIDHPPPETVTSIEELSSQMEAMQEEINRLREEAEVRNKLQATVEEETEQEKEILSAAGQDYSLSREGTLGITYGFGYSYNSTDILEDIIDPEVDHSSNHNLTNSISFKYAFKNNITFNGAVPFVYKSDQRSTSNERNATDIGDFTLGALWQPTKSDGKSATIIYNTSFVFPSGTSPYKIDADNALSTGSGFYSIAAGASVSKSYDPIFAFASASFNYPFNATGLSQRREGPNDETVLTEVEPGKSIGVNIGIAYALSYIVSVNTSFSYSYTTRYSYTWQGGSESTSGASTSAVLNVGTGWRLSPRRSISTTLGIGLTNSASDFTFSFTIPFDYKL